MKKVLIACHLALLALGWFVLSWFFFNPTAISAQDPRGTEPAFDFGIEDESGRNWSHRGGYLYRMMMEELNLSEEQKGRIRSILAEEWPLIKPMIQQLRQGREQFDSFSEDDSFDDARVRAVAAQQAEIIVELMVMRERTKSKVFAALSQDQRAEAQRLFHVLRGSHSKGFMP